MFRIRENEIADALTTSDIWIIMLKEFHPIAAEYFVGGADELTTLKANVLAFKQVLIAPRGAIKNKYIDTTSKYLEKNFLFLFLFLLLEVFEHFGLKQMQLRLKSQVILELQCHCQQYPKHLWQMFVKHLLVLNGFNFIFVEGEKQQKEEFYEQNKLDFQL